MIPANTFPAGTPYAACDRVTISSVTMPVRQETDTEGRPLPYFVRIHVDDGHGGSVDSYAMGTVRVLASAVGVVDLLSVGAAVTGNVWQGFFGDPFDPARGARAGAAIAGIGDLDGDSLSEFAIAAESATPFSRTRVGTVYLIY